VTSEGFSSYDNLLASTTRSGEPLGYKGDSLKVSEIAIGARGAASDDT